MARDRRFLVEYARMLAGRLRRRLERCSSLACLLTGVLHVYRTAVRDLGPEDAREVVRLVLSMVEPPEGVDPEMAARVIAESEMYRDLAAVVDLVVEWLGGRPPRVVVAVSLLRSLKNAVADVRGRLERLLGLLRADLLGGIAEGLLDASADLAGLWVHAEKPSILTGLDIAVPSLADTTGDARRLVDAARIIACTETGVGECDVLEEEAAIEAIEEVIAKLRGAEKEIDTLIEMLEKGGRGGRG